MVGNKFNDVRIDRDQSRSGPRFHAILRGRLDPHIRDFVGGGIWHH